jgi:hypothetical protein
MRDGPPSESERYVRAAQAIVAADVELARDLIANVTPLAALEGRVETSAPMRLRLLRDALRAEVAATREAEPRTWRPAD